MNLHLTTIPYLTSITLPSACSPGPTPRSLLPDRPTAALSAALPIPPTPRPGSTETATPQIAPPWVDSTATAPGDSIGAERSVRDHFECLSEGRAVDPRSLFTLEYLAKSPDPAGATALSYKVASVESPQVGVNRIGFLVQIDVRGAAESLDAWNAGANARFVDVMRTAPGWRINEIASSPPASRAASGPANWRRSTTRHG